MANFLRSIPFVCVFFLAACGGSDKIRFDIKLTVNDPAKLSAEARAVYDLLEGGQEIPLNSITEALAKSHVNHYENGASKLADLLKLVDEAKGNAPDGDPHKRKVQYEDWITKKLGSATVYNLAANTLFHFLLDNKMQCYSGTVLNQLVNRKSVSPEDFRNQNWVVIYESGHILSGYLKQNGGKWNLFGIETTAEGEALVEYGPVDSITSEFRIVDADYWALVELFKFDLKDAVGNANAILDFTASKYGVPANKVMRVTSAESLTKINQSPFGFGNADVMPGDKPRTGFDKRVRANFTGANTNPLLGGYREPIRTDDKSVLVMQIQQLIQEKQRAYLRMPSNGKFCTEYSRYGGYGGVCGPEGASVTTLMSGSYGSTAWQNVSVEALAELYQALQAASG